MNSFRKRLGAWSVAWLLCQVASLAVLLPPECCDAHQAAAADQKECLLPVAGDQCPMVGVDGQPCPMHQAGAAETDKTCHMRGMCSGASAALGVFFALPGVLAPAASLSAPAAASLVTVEASPLATAPVSFDTPPPKA